MAYARNNLRRWTSSDDRELRRLVEGNAPVAVASMMLGRTVDSVLYRMKTLGLSRRKRNLRPYSKRAGKETL